MINGLAGIIYPNTQQISDLIFPMLKILRYRAAAEQETYTYKNLQFGACRALAFNEKKTIVLALDGFIENLPELQKELKKSGHACDGSSVQELLLCAYAHWDIHFLDKINGDFSIVLFDQAKECLYLVRDRIGKKPLYWYDGKNYFIFASEIKSMLASGVIPQTPAGDALATYLSFGYFPQDITPIKDINKLLPGHYLQFHLNIGKTIQRYWSYRSFFKNQSDRPEDSIVCELNELLTQAVQQRIPQDHLPGCLVTGGLGSATIAYYVRKALPKQSLDTFSVCFKGQNEEDVEAAKQISAQLHLKPHVDVIDAGTLLDELARIVWHLDEPIGDPNNISGVWKLAQAARHSSSVFSGMGSDELFAGHAAIVRQKGKRSFLIHGEKSPKH